MLTVTVTVTVSVAFRNVSIAVLYAMPHYIEQYYNEAPQYFLQCAAIMETWEPIFLTRFKWKQGMGK